MGIQASASRTGLLLDCTFAFGQDLEVEPEPSREPARYGSAFHQVLAVCLRVEGATAKPKPIDPGRYAREIDKAAKHYDVRPAAEELAGHVRSSFKVLRNWLVREKLKIAEIETAYAVNPAKMTARLIPPHDEEHHYDVKEGEIPGTVDLNVHDENRELTIDHKTGGEDTGFATPSKMPQMRTLGLALKKNPHVGVFHADRRGLPMVYAEEYEEHDRKKHARQLTVAMSRIGDGFMRPGPHCPRCPAQDVCPARSADLLSESTAALVSAANVLADEPVDPRRSLAPVGGSTLEMRAAALHKLLQRFRALDKAGSDEIRRLVKDGRVIETVDGVLTLRPQSYEWLSKKSVMTKLGKVRGERLLKELRKKGVIETKTREMLVPEK